MNNKYIFVFLLAIAVNCASAISSHAQPGSLDTTFNHSGIVIQDIAGKNDYGFATAVQADGKILTAGFGNIDTVTYNDFVVIRYKVNGEIDSTFGVNGYAITNFSTASDDEAMSICIQPDGKIVAGGRTCSTGRAYDFAIVRYDTNGTLDASFGTGGKVTTDISGFNDYGSCLRLQSDGKIVMTGYTYNGVTSALAVARYNSNGTLDNTFDGDGIAIIQRGDIYPDGQSLAIQGDGKIVVSATSKLPINNYDVLVARLNTNGTPDNTFNGDGIVTTDVCYHDEAHSLAIQADGKIVVVGRSNDTVNVTMGTNLMLVRYNANGSIDSSFGRSGKVITDATNQPDIAFAVTIQRNGKIIAVGHSSDGVSNFQILLTRYLTDGRLDSTFGVNGIVVTNMASEHEFGEAVALQTDGKIVVTGFVNNGSNFNVFTARYTGDSVIGLGATTVVHEKLQVYPNPCTNTLFVELPVELDGASMCLVNMNGQKVQEMTNVCGRNYAIDCQHINSGVYVLFVSKDGLLVDQQTVIVDRK